MTRFSFSILYMIPVALAVGAYRMFTDFAAPPISAAWRFFGRMLDVAFPATAPVVPADATTAPPATLGRHETRSFLFRRASRQPARHSGGWAAPSLSLAA